MNRIAFRLMATVIALLTISCSSEEAQAQTSTSYMDINITIDGKTLVVHLVDNSATRELVAALQQAPITYEANDYGGFEKVGALGRSLPTSDSQITTEAGDVILYSGNQIVLFYGSNSWSYTRLGRIDHPNPAGTPARSLSLDELKAFLKAGQGRISVTLSIPESSGIIHHSVGKRSAKAHSLSGTELKQSPTKGLYIREGKKVVK